MKMKTSTGKKLRYGGISAVVTAVIIVAIILFNVIFSALSHKFTWYADLTPDLLFTLSDECIDLLRNGDDEFENSSSPIEMVDKIRAENKQYNADNGLSAGMEGYRDENIMINLIFCDDPDVWENNTSMNYVYNTAKELQSEFPDHISIKNPNIVHNPSSVTKYKVNSLTTIAPTSVIVEFGTEYRIRSVESFFTSNPDDGEIWAYSGEKAFAASILSVTRVESPLACITINHREGLSDTSLLQTLSDAGYKIDDIDLKNEEIPEDCRLLVIFDPKDDFLVKDGTTKTDVDEIEKIDKFLDETNSMMVFVSPDTPVLKNLEEYLAEWGIKFDRHTDAAGTTHPYMIKDSENSLTSNGFTVVADYVTNNPVSSITKDMRSRAVPQSVVFPNVMSISPSDIYSPQRYVDEEDSSIAYNYASYSADGISRAMYNLFTTSATASAFANGSEVEKASEQNRLALMTVSVEDRTVQESNYTTVNEASYVVACGSTEFASEAFLQSNAYGNTDLLLSVCRSIGREPVPVGLGFKAFADFTIDTVTSKEATQYTVVLTVVPVLVATVAGIVVLVRRKHR